MAPSTPSSSGGGAAATRTTEARKDPVFNRWVIFSPARARRPSDFKSSTPSTDPNPNASPSSAAAAPPSCPFCIGREHECAPEIFRLPPGTSEWKIRVIENLYPALRRDVDPPDVDAEHSDGPSGSGRVVVRGFGFHDVVIETPYHSVHLSDLSPLEAGKVVLAYKERVLQLASLGSIKYIQVFKNYGASAGASMSHSHSQIMGLPFVPPTVSARLNSMKDFFSRTGKCSLCEVQSEDILIDESSHFFSLVPFAASFPFEIWIVPRDHTPHFHEIDHEKAVDLGGLLKLMLQKLSRQLNDPPFNFMIHTSPLDATASSSPYSHWFIQIVPQLTRIGGFEMGSGSYINPVFPEDGAKLLREVNLEI